MTGRTGQGDWCVTWLCATTILAAMVSSSQGTDCLSRCDAEGRVVTGEESDDFCSIRLPDNPYRRRIHDDPYGQDEEIVPCQMEIHSNCSNYCHIQLTFNKFQLPECGKNLTNFTENCDLINECEYIILHERGLDKEGQAPTHVIHFHGNYSQQTFETKTDKVLLQFCYRSETFAARNIQLQYKAVEPSSSDSVTIGPVSVWVLCFIVVILGLAIAWIRWHPAAKQCLDPPPQQRKARRPENV